MGYQVGIAETNRKEKKSEIKFGSLCKKYVDKLQYSACTQTPYKSWVWKMQIPKTANKHKNAVKILSKAQQFEVAGAVSRRHIAGQAKISHLISEFQSVATVML